VFALIAFALCGCGGNGNSVDNETTAEPGKVEKITTAQLVEKMNQKEDFALVFTQTTCGHCQAFLSIMDVYMKDHNVLLYDMVLDEEPDVDAALAQLKTVFPDFTATPDVYCVEKGEIKSRFWEEYDSLDESTFHDWVKKYGLMKQSEQ